MKRFFLLLFNGLFFLFILFTLIPGLLLLGEKDSIFRKLINPVIWKLMDLGIDKYMAVKITVIFLVLLYTFLTSLMYRGIYYCIAMGKTKKPEP